MISGNWAILDPIATILIALFILKVAIDIAKTSINEVVDKSAPKEFENEIMNLFSKKVSLFVFSSYKRVKRDLKGIKS